MTETPYLPLKGIYFDQIKAGEKLHEYRLATPYWRARLDNPDLNYITLMRGYPRRDDLKNRLTMFYEGYFFRANFTHEHFGAHPVDVFSINVNYFGQGGTNGW